MSIPMKQLTEDLILAIANSELPVTRCARKYDVSPSTVLGCQHKIRKTVVEPIVKVPCRTLTVDQWIDELNKQKENNK